MPSRLLSRMTASLLTAVAMSSVLLPLAHTAKLPWAAVACNAVCQNQRRKITVQRTVIQNQKAALQRKQWTINQLRNRPKQIVRRQPVRTIIYRQPVQRIIYQQPIQQVFVQPVASVNICIVEADGSLWDHRSVSLDEWPYYQDQGYSACDSYSY